MCEITPDVLKWSRGQKHIVILYCIFFHKWRFLHNLEHLESKRGWNPSTWSSTFLLFNILSSTVEPWIWISKSLVSLSLLVLHHIQIDFSSSEQELWTCLACAIPPPAVCVWEKSSFHLSKRSVLLHSFSFYPLHFDHFLFCWNALICISWILWCHRWIKVVPWHYYSMICLACVPIAESEGLYSHCYSYFYQ